MSVGNSMVGPQEVTNVPPTSTQGVPMLGRLPAPVSQLALLLARPILLLFVPLLCQVCLSPLVISVDGKNFWILDLRTTYHLIDSSKHFVSSTPCASNEKIRTVDGSLSLIANKMTNSSLRQVHSSEGFLCV